MRIVADENIESEIIDHLRSLNFEVYCIRESSSGINDEEVLKEANKEGSILLTSDKDFGELIYRMKLISSGVIFLRLNDVPVSEKSSILSTVLATHIEKLPNSFTVINKTSIRIRKLK